MTVSQKNLNPQKYLHLLIVYKWWIVLSFATIFPVTFIYSHSLPPTYRSTTLILVERQKVPESFVQAIITSTMQDRLSTISQQIMSRKNLENIINTFGLYKNTQKYAVTFLNWVDQQVNHSTNFDSEKVLIKIDKVIVSLGLSKGKGVLPLEESVEYMRKDIEVKVVGGQTAFTVSYQGTNPVTVMNVTNTLASLFIEENLKIREQQAEGTSAFLESQLVEAKGQLEKQEVALKEFKMGHMGELPGQLEVNLRALDRLQLELQTLGEALKNVQDRKITVERLQQELQRSEESSGGVDPPKASASIETGSLRQRTTLERLKEELSKLQAQFNDNYPDIVLLKEQINEAERQLHETEIPSNTETVPAPSREEKRKTITQQLAERSASEAITAEISSSQRRQERARELINEYERKIEATFSNEQALLNLTRDYEMSQRIYQNLLEKRLNARISENMEKRQKGEQFRILDAANLPQMPYGADRQKILLLGSLAGVGVGVGASLLKEYLRPSFRTSDDVNETVDLPVLTTIPRDKFGLKKGHQLVTVKEPDATVVEQYRVLYSKMRQLSRGNSHNVWAISSSIKAEGKTTTTLNLAVVMARDFGKKTLVIEGDFQSPVISHYLESRPLKGLGDFLSNNMDIQSVLVSFVHENLSVLPSLKGTRKSASLLSSNQMRDMINSLREKYDIILIDSPPVLPLVDMRIYEEMVDSIILVVRAERTPKSALINAVNTLATKKLVGIVLNDLGQSSLRSYQDKNRTT